MTTHVKEGTVSTALLKLPTQDVNLRLVEGTEHELAVDISALRAETGCITLDSGFSNTGACESAITFIDGEKGILRYRGYPIEELAHESTFIEVAWLLIWGELPTPDQLNSFRQLLSESELLHEGMRHQFEGFPTNGHPMAMLSAVINACGCYHPELLDTNIDEDQFRKAAAILISKVRTIAAFSYKMSYGQRMEYPDPKLSYCNNFLHMMFSRPNARYEASPAVVKALRQFLILHADHEQNCSTSTVRMVGSSGANLFASAASGVCALWGPLHGGANMAVIEMLERIHEGGDSVKSIVEKAKNKQFLLMGFGHRVYKTYDPRARALGEVAERLGSDDQRLALARHVEQTALRLLHEYKPDRRLYTNVEYYAAAVLETIDLDPGLYTPTFAVSRTAGWTAHMLEQIAYPRLIRPQVDYVGPMPKD